MHWEFFCDVIKWVGLFIIYSMQLHWLLLLLLWTVTHSHLPTNTFACVHNFAMEIGSEWEREREKTTHVLYSIAIMLSYIARREKENQDKFMSDGDQNTFNWKPLHAYYTYTYTYTWRSFVKRFWLLNELVNEKEETIYIKKNRQINYIILKWSV